LAQLLSQLGVFLTSIAKPASRANLSAPSAVSRINRSSLATFRAALIGLRTSLAEQTAPARIWSPSPLIIAASISTRPSIVTEEPCAQLKSGESSMTTTAASTASSLLPPVSRIFAPARIESSSVSWYSCSCAEPAFTMTPAPPWMAIDHAFLVTEATGAVHGVARLRARCCRRRPWADPEPWTILST
jgi:hypothetical protein